MSGYPYPDSIHWPHDKAEVLPAVEAAGLELRHLYNHEDERWIWAIWDVENEVWLDV